MSKDAEEELEYIDDDISTLDLQHVGKSKSTSVLFSSQDSAPMPTEVEMMKAQYQDFYCRNLQGIISSGPTLLLKKSSLPCQRSA